MNKSELRLCPLCARLIYDGPVEYVRCGNELIAAHKPCVAESDDYEVT